MPRNGTRKKRMLDAGERQDAAGEHHAGELRRRRHLAQVVDQPDGEDHDARRARRRARAVLASNTGVELVEHPRDGDGGEQPESMAAHRGSGSRVLVDAPLVRGHDGTDPHREPAEEQGGPPPR